MTMLLKTLIALAMATPAYLTVNVANAQTGSCTPPKLKVGGQCCLVNPVTGKKSQCIELSWAASGFGLALPIEDPRPKVAQPLCKVRHTC